MLRRIVSVLLLFVFASVLTFAQPPRRPMPPTDMPPPPEAIFKKLNLSEAQETQMKKLRIELMKKQTQLHSKIQTLRLDIKGLFLADKVDRKAIESDIKLITDSQEQLKLNMVGHWFDVNSILNPEQQKIWKEHAMQTGEKMRAGMRDRLRMRIEKRIEEEPDFD